MSKKREKLLAVKNEVGAQEVDKLVIRKKTGWEKVKYFIISKKTRSFLWAIFRTVMFLGLGFIIIYPLLIQLTTSLKTEMDLYDSTVIFIPRTPTIEAYTTMWNYLSMPKLLTNSLLWSLLLGLLQMVSCMFVAYGLARFQFKGRGIVFGLVIITLVVPAQLLTDSMTLRYKYFNPLTMFSMNIKCFQKEAMDNSINLVGSWTIFLLMGATATMFKNGLFIFMLRQYFRNQPKELEEAAYIDGCGTIRTFLQVMLPSALPLLVTVFLFAFVWQYNDSWFIPVLYPAAPVLSTKVENAAYSYVVSVLGEAQNTPLMSIYKSACLIVYIAPLVVLYTFCQRFFVQSIERSGMVG